MTDDQKQMKVEMARVRHFLSESVQDVEAEQGDLRFFSAAFLTAAIQLCVEIDGPEGLERALAKIGQQELVRSGRAARC